MEQWEKEYIEEVTKLKRAQNQGKAFDCSYEEGYDSSRWVEIKNADGTKYYVPKEYAFDNHRTRKQKQRTNSFWPKCSKFPTCFIGILVGLALLTGLLMNIGQNKRHDIEWAKVEKNISLQGFIHGKLLGATYINGYGFADMMHFFEEMQEERHSFLNEIAENINDVSKIDVEEWSRVIDDREKRLAKLKYASSYQQYVNAEKEVFLKQKELLTLVKHHAEIHIVLELYNQLSTADLSLRSKLIEALEKNGIEYSVNQNELVYWYKSY